MIEPTESESKAELDRLVNALIAIRGEIRDIEEGRADKKDNVLKNAPHPAQEVLADNWDHPYSRELVRAPSLRPPVPFIHPYVQAISFPTVSCLPQKNVSGAVRHAWRADMQHRMQPAKAASTSFCISAR